MLRSPGVSLVLGAGARGWESRRNARVPPAPRSTASNPGGNAALEADKGLTRVKFVLQRKCMFGEHFRVIGAHPSLGEWDPEAAIPLEWSDGHHWTAELDVPQGSVYEYKFVLKCRNGWTHWQPGPNRVFATGKTSVVVSQTWESDGACSTELEELCGIEDDAATPQGRDGGGVLSLVVEESREERGIEASTSAVDEVLTLDTEESLEEGSEDSTLLPDVEDRDEVVTAIAIEASSILTSEEQAVDEAIVLEPEVQAPRSEPRDEEISTTLARQVETNANAIDVQAEPTGLTIWQKDRTWFVKLLDLIFKKR